MSDYKIASHWTKQGLENQVNEYMERGYKPVGSVTSAMTDTYANDGELESEYTQAVIKDAE